MTPQEKIRNKKAIMILEQNITTKILKGRMVSNGKPTRYRLSRGGNSHPTASLDFFEWQQSMHIRDDISWFWVLPTHSFRPTYYQIKMVKKGQP